MEMNSYHCHPAGKEKTFVLHAAFRPLELEMIAAFFRTVSAIKQAMLSSGLMSQNKGILQLLRLSSG